MTRPIFISLTAGLFAILCIAGCARHRSADVAGDVVEADQGADPLLQFRRQLLEAMERDLKDDKDGDDIPTLQRECDADGSSCSRLASALEASAQRAHHTRAFGLRRKLCEERDTASCDALARAYLKGRGCKRQPAKALAIYLKLEREGVPYFMDQLAWFYEQGVVVKRDPARAWKIYVKACEGGASVSCWAVGKGYLEGKHVPVDRAKAYAAFTKGCSDPDLPACAEAAKLRKALGRR